MKLYVISGLGADFKVLEKLTFSENIEINYIDWLIPEKNETFENYVKRMASKIDRSEPFYLLGYSFGGIMVQEINKIYPAEKVVILGSIKSHKEASVLMKIGRATNIPAHLPSRFYSEKSAYFYGIFRKIIDPKNPKLLQYFNVRNPYYLKWSIEKIVKWNCDQNPDVIQILADKDIVFPIKKCKPDFVIRNATHLFPATKYKEVSAILKTIFV